MFDQINLQYSMITYVDEKSILMKAFENKTISCTHMSIAYNKTIDNNPYNISTHINSEKYIVFGYKFNEQLDDKYLRIMYLNSCNTIIFDESINARKYSKFNKPITLLPLEIKKLVLGYHFTCSVGLSKNLTMIKFGDKFNRSFGYRQLVLPKKLLEVSFGTWFNSKVVLPKYLRVVKFGFCFDQMVHLSKQLVYVSFDTVFKQSVFIPKNVIFLKIDNCFEYGLGLYSVPGSVRGPGLGKKIKHLELGNRFNQPIILPKNLTTLKWGYGFQQRIFIPESLYKLEVRCPNNWFVVEQTTGGLKQLIHFSPEKIPKGILSHTVYVVDMFS